jgi:hypothetical protein
MNVSARHTSDTAGSDHGTVMIVSPSGGTVIGRVKGPGARSFAAEVTDLWMG